MSKNRKQKSIIRTHATDTAKSYTAALWEQRRAQLSRYTGEPMSNAPAHQSWRRPAPAPLPIGTALSTGSVGQMRFEAAVMEQLCRAGGFYWAHPFGIAAVHPEPNGIVLDLDDRTVINSHRGRHQQPSMAEFLLHQVLPSCDESDSAEVRGIPGLRVATHRRGQTHDLQLLDVSGQGTVTLHAPAGTEWRRILDGFERDLRSAGSQPLWTEPEQTHQETHHRSRLDWLGRARLASIGSGLLRRINLFYGASTAYTTSSWLSDSWIVEFRAVRAAGHPHQEFLDALTDPVWGMPLEPWSYDCRCANQAALWETQCDIDFRSSDGGGLELRFRCGHDISKDWRACYERVGAGTGWLDRVLPQRLVELSR